MEHEKNWYLIYTNELFPWMEKVLAENMEKFSRKFENRTLMYLKALWIC
jgi:hypothetical protein